jgi:EAL domain-containing protein (putative c-di-GMP-specific phosphodiesterase class I)
VVDHQSRNGTFVNGQRIADRAPVRVGDVIHFATHGYEVVPGGANSGESMDPTVHAESISDVQGLVDLLHVIKDQRTFPHFQPIVDLQSGNVAGYEALGRAATLRGSVELSKLFRVAEQTHDDLALSGRFRESARACTECRHCWTCPDGVTLFLNIHPSEIRDPAFMTTLEDLGRSELTRWYRLAVELPEKWVSKTDQIRELSAKLRGAGIAVAYDDFGVGQSRLPDLMTAPPDFLKLDRQLITGLPHNRVAQDLVRALASACADLGATVLAEGIELEEERTACLDMGIPLGQGFLLGRPEPAYALFDTPVDTLVDSCPFVKLNLVTR